MGDPAFLCYWNLIILTVQQRILRPGQGHFFPGAP